MRTLEFEVMEQVLQKKEDCKFTDIVAGSIGYLQAKFYFKGDEWKDCIKVAGFWSDGQEYAAVLDENDSCIIPKEALTKRKFVVSMTGAREGYRIKTTKTEVKQEVT